VVHDTVMKQVEIAELLENLKASKHQVSFLLSNNNLYLYVVHLIFMKTCLYLRLPNISTIY
jgi:hypothetical protein